MGGDTAGRVVDVPEGPELADHGIGVEGAVNVAETDAGRTGTGRA